METPIVELFNRYDICRNIICLFSCGGMGAEWISHKKPRKEYLFVRKCKIVSTERRAETNPASIALSQISVHGPAS